MSVQCELERGGFSRERGIVLRRCEAQLLASHGTAWANLDGLASDPVFRRGVVDEVKVKLDGFLQREDELWRRAPDLRFVHFTGLGDLWPAYDLEPALLERALLGSRLTGFGALDPYVMRSVEGAFVDSWEVALYGASLVRWLVTTGRLAKLRRLQVRSLEAPGLELLAREGTALEDLRLHGALATEATPATLAKIAETKLRPERLALVDRDESVADLLATPIASQARHLELGLLAPCLGALPGSVRVLRGEVEARDDFEAIARASTLDAVEDLAFVGERLSPKGLDLSRLRERPPPPSLRVFRVDSTLLTPAEARALVKSRWAAPLEAIDLRPARPEIVQAVANARWDGAVLV